MDKLKILFDLQNANREKSRLEKLLKTLPQVKELKDLKKAIELAQTEIQQIGPKLESYRKNLKKEEQLISGFKDKVKMASDLLYSGEITNVKELESAKKNLETEQAKISTVEEKAILLMEKIEEFENKIRLMLKELEDKKSKFRDLNKQYVKEKESISHSIQEIDNWTENTRKALPPDLMESFQVLCRKFDDGQGIGLLRQGVCSGCHMSVSFDLLKKAKVMPGKIICDNCGRWLIPE